MSTKFEQLLDYLVNEEMDKANELFHEIVVEKSREIYENLIAVEEESENMDQEDSDTEQLESITELEDSYDMEATDSDSDPTDNLLDKVEVDDEESDDDMDDEFDSEMGDEEAESSEDEAMMDIKNAIEELEAAFAELEASKGEEMGDEFDSEMSDKEGDEEPEMMGMYEGKKRMTREYVEKVGNDWNGTAQKAQGKDAGAGTGESVGSPTEGKSPVSSGKGKPVTGATAANIASDKSTGEGTNVGTTPSGKASGLVKPAQDMKTGNGNVPGGKMGVKNLSKVSGGHGAEKKGSEVGPVGAGTGSKTV